MNTKPDLMNSSSDVDNGVRFIDIFNLEDIQRLQDLFSDATGVASIITHPNGTPITNISNSCRLCNDIIRKTEKGRANCFKSDATLGRHNPSGPLVQPCLSGGLWDAGASISVGGKHIANWLIGQVRNEEVDEKRLIQYADEIGANREEFLEALAEVPVMSVKQFKKVSEMLFAFANELSEKAYTNLQLKMQIAEREKATDLLQKSKESLSIMLQSIGDGVLSTDRNGLIVDMNPIAEHLCGWKMSEAEGKPSTEVFNIINSESRKPVDDPVKKVLETGKIIGLANHTILISKNGTEYQIADSVAPIKNKEGLVCGVVLVFSDITEKHEADKALKEIEIKYRDLVDNSPDAISVQVEEKIVFVNKEFLHLTAAASAEELIGKPVMQFVHPDYRELVIERMKNSTSEGVVLPLIEEKFIRFDGSEIDVEIKAMPIRLQNKPAVQLIFRDITERKRIDETLKSTLSLLEATLESIHNGVLVISDRGTVIKTNAKFGEMWCIPGEILASKDDKALLDYVFGQLADPDEFIATVSRLYGEPEAESLDLIYFKDGRIFERISKPIYLGNEPKGRIWSFLDVTEQKRTEETLQNERLQLRTLIDNIPDLIYSKDLACRKTLANLTDVQFMGVKSEAEVVGRDDFYFFPKEIAEKFFADDQSVIQTGRPVLYREEYTLDEKGQKIWLLTSKLPLRDKDNQIIGLIGIGRDITESKRAEERLKEQADAMEATIDGLALLNADMKYTYLNKSHAEIYGYDNASELIGSSWRVLYDTGELQRFEREILPELIKNGHYQGSAVGKKKDGSTFPQAISLTLLGNGGLICIVRDITDRQRAENEIIKAKEKAEESDRLKSAFLANMSHEIRTPMNGILGFAELLKERDLTSEKQQEYLDIIMQSGVRMLSILNDIIDISKIESGLMDVNVKESNVNEQIEYIYTFFKPEVEGKGMQLFFKNSLPSKESIIKTDREKVYAILINLVKNAIKFTSIGYIEFGYEKKGKFLEFFVSDTGKGIHQDQKELIFERFRQGSESLTRNYEGSGLGLSISKAYVEMLGGRIWVDSEVGKGSTFYFTIPYNTESVEIIATKKVVSADRTENQIKPLKILIAEDDNVSAILLDMAVNLFGKEVLKARTGVEVVEACRNNPDIDLILMDIKMPDMDGYEATIQIRQFNKDVVIIAQTAYTLTGDREMAIETGCNEYISKPIKKDELIALILKYFKK